MKHRFTDKSELKLALIIALVFNLLITRLARSMTLDEMGNPNQVEMPCLPQTQADAHRSRSTIARRPHGQATVFNLYKLEESDAAIAKVAFP